MADWYGTCRSNYFRVKDRSAFEHWLDSYEARLIVDEKGRVGFYSTDHYGSIPTYWDGSDDDNSISILDEIHQHLAENEVCIVMEAGAEKLRYISGQAIAIAWTGERTSISLSDIYAQAQEEFGGDAQITEAIY